MRLIWLLFFMFALTAESFAQVNVKGYYRKDGTYVAPHVRSSPDSYKWNNYGPSSSSPEYQGKGHVTSPYTRDLDRDGIANLLDFDDNNDGIHDDGYSYKGLLNSKNSIRITPPNNAIQTKQPTLTANNFQKIPGAIAQLLLSDSAAYGEYNTEPNNPATFVEHLNADGRTSLFNTQGSSKFQRTGVWGIQGENLCFKYTDENIVCHDLRLMPNGIGVFDLTNNGVLSATITKIENSEFLFDFENGTGLSTDVLDEATALLGKMKENRAQ